MFGYTYHYLLTEGSIDHIKQDSFTLKVAAQKGDGLFLVALNRPNMKWLKFFTLSVLKLFFV